MISEFFIRRPIVAMVIAILTVVVGALAMRSFGSEEEHHASNQETSQRTSSD